jgi:hypothetical protein
MIHYRIVALAALGAVFVTPASGADDACTTFKWLLAREQAHHRRCAGPGAGFSADAPKASAS